MHVRQRLICTVSPADGFLVAGGGCRREGGLGGRQPKPPPPSTLHPPSTTHHHPLACWELGPAAELEGGTEGHSPLFSPLHCRLVAVTHFVMDGKTKSVREETRT